MFIRKSTHDRIVAEMKEDRSAAEKASSGLLIAALEQRAALQAKLDRMMAPLKAANARRKATAKGEA